MNYCTVDRRAEARDAADQLATTPTVAAVDVLAPDEGPRDEWTIEAIVDRTSVGPKALFAIATHGLRVETMQTRSASQTTHVVATVPR